MKKRVRKFIKKYKIKEILTATFSLFFIGFLVWYSHRQDLEDSYLEYYGLAATATVTDKLPISYRGSQTPYLKVKYTDNTRLDHDVAVTAPRDVYEDVSVGQQIDITYDPAEPNSAKLRYYPYNNWSWVGRIILIIAIPLAAIPIIIAYYLYIAPIWWKRKKT